LTSNQSANKQSFVMKKIILLFVSAAFSLSLFAQQDLPDTMSTNDKALMKLFGTLIQSKAKEFLQNDRDSRSLKTTLGNTLKKTLQQSLSGSLPNFQNPKTFLENPLTALQLPNQLQMTQDQFLQKGKENLLNNLKQAANEAAMNALQNSFSKIMENIVTMDIDSLVKYGNSDSGLTMTNIYKLSKLDQLKSIIGPAAVAAFAVAGGEKLLRKTERFYNRNNEQPLNLNMNEFITNGAIQGLTNIMNQKEAELKSNPLPLLQGLIENLLKN
jgi:hypothetical protein